MSWTMQGIASVRERPTAAAIAPSFPLLVIASGSRRVGGHVPSTRPLAKTSRSAQAHAATDLHVTSASEKIPSLRRRALVPLGKEFLQALVDAVRVTDGRHGDLTADDLLPRLIKNLHVVRIDRNRRFQ